jgi:hypothetical protein
MRRFFPPQLRVGLQVVARPLPHVIQPVQRAAEGVLGYQLPRGDLQGLPEQGHGPVGVRVAEVLRGTGQETRQEVLLVLVQQGVPPPAALVVQRLGVERLGVQVDPVVDALAGHAEHPGDGGDRASLVELQDGEGAPQDAGIQGSNELAAKPLPLPRSQLKLAHTLLLGLRSESRANLVSK